MSSTFRQSGATAGRLMGRRVLFADSLGQGLLQPGIVAGVERDELTLHTPAPATVGAEVQLELAGDGGAGDVLYLPGRVLRVAPLGNGEYAMGLRILAGKPLPRQSPVWQGPPVAPAAREKPSEPEPEPEAASSPPPRRRKSLWLLVLVVLILWMGIIEGLRRLRIPVSNPPEPEPHVGSPAKPPEEVAPDPTGSSADFARTTPPRRSSPAPKAPDAAEADMERIPPSSVRVPEAVAVLAIEDWESSSSPRTFSFPLSDAALAPVDSGAVPADDALPEPADSEIDPADEVSVVVEKGRHRLTIYRRGRPVRSFVVGLGRDDSTPTGEFRVVSKATDPDWHHNGRIIPGGSPGNRIGRRWLGLGSDGLPSGYGIHPAKNPHTVGKSLSQGCIQMRSEDAEALFRFCPVGTPVIVRP